MKFKEKLIGEYKKTTARDWFSFSFYMVALYCGLKVFTAFFMDHLILRVFVADYFREKGNLKTAELIISNIEWFGYYVLLAVICWGIYKWIKPKEKISEAKT